MERISAIAYGPTQNFMKHYTWMLFKAVQSHRK